MYSIIAPITEKEIPAAIICRKNGPIPSKAEPLPIASSKPLEAVISSGLIRSVIEIVPTTHIKLQLKELTLI